MCSDHDLCTLHFAYSRTLWVFLCLLFIQSFLFPLNPAAHLSFDPDATAMTARRRSVGRQNLIKSTRLIKPTFLAVAIDLIVYLLFLARLLATREIALVHTT